MKRALLPLLASCLLLTAAYGCDAKKEEGKEDATAKADADKADGDKAKEAEAEDTKAEDAKAEDAKAEAAPAAGDTKPEAAAGDAEDDTKGLGHLAHEKGKIEDKPAAEGDAAKAAPPAPHLAVDKAKNDGALAHAATAVAHSDIDDKGKEAMLKVSHEESVDPTDEALCKHVLEIMFDELGADLDDATKKELEEELMEECPEEVAKERVKLGPTVFQEAADCFMKAKTIDELDACDAAEEEAEEKLHEAPTGDGLSKETCTEFYDHFSKLALDELGELEGMKETLEEIKDDLVTACMDHGTKAEIECAMKAKTVDELEECE